VIWRHLLVAQPCKNQLKDGQPDATANAALAARFPYLFATTPTLPIYLEVIVRDKVGRSQRQRRYAGVAAVLEMPMLMVPFTSSEETKARQAPCGAEVAVEKCR